MRKSVIGLVMFVLAFGHSIVSNAEIRGIQASVVQTLVSLPGQYGGCMVKLSSTLGGGCGAWVTFSCDGTWTTKDIAYRMFDTAMAAYALNKQVKIFVDTEQMVNEAYCQATRVDLLP